MKRFIYIHLICVSLISMHISTFARASGCMDAYFVRFEPTYASSHQQIPAPPGPYKDSCFACSYDIHKEPPRMNCTCFDNDCQKVYTQNNEGCARYKNDNGTLRCAGNGRVTREQVLGRSRARMDVPAYEDHDLDEYERMPQESDLEEYERMPQESVDAVPKTAQDIPAM